MAKFISPYFQEYVKVDDVEYLIELEEPKNEEERERELAFKLEIRRHLETEFTERTRKSMLKTPQNAYGKNGYDFLKYVKGLINKSFSPYFPSRSLELVIESKLNEFENYPTHKKYLEIIIKSLKEKRCINTKVSEIFKSLPVITEKED